MRHHVDWADVERRGHRGQSLASATMLVALAAWFAVLHTPWSPAWSWGYIALLWLFLLGQSVRARIDANHRARLHEGYRMFFALRHHVDPGPGVREKVDRYARFRVRTWWFPWWLVLVAPIGPLIGADWSRPWVTVPCALVIAAAVTSAALWLRRTHLAARQWVADPPGPPREPPPPTTAERWLTGARGLAVVGGAFVVLVLGGLLIALAA